MKKIGLIGGISWVSTSDYYSFINQGINAKLGGLNFAECIIHSFNYADIKKNNDAGDWDKTLDMLTNASLGLKSCGAEAIVLCANTMHMIVDKLEQRIQIPVINIASVTAKEIRSQKIEKVGLLGTKFTMEMDFFKSKLNDLNIVSVIPEEEDRTFIHYTIFEELGRGLVLEETKKRYVSIINKLIKEGAQGIILGCTEIPLLIKQEDINVPVFDTTLIHSNAAVEFMLNGKS
ncbi:MAG: aspartate racemase [Bacteroidetes bacterium]|jgi:aspartate racemase|nr:aspartate racemase [Bacteroidota bacterium]